MKIENPHCTHCKETLTDGEMKIAIKDGDLKCEDGVLSELYCLKCNTGFILKTEEVMTFLNITGMLNIR